MESGKSFGGAIFVGDFLSLWLLLLSSLCCCWSSSSSWQRRSGSFVAGVVCIASNATPSRHTAAMERGEEDMRVSRIESSPPEEDDCFTGLRLGVERIEEDSTKVLVVMMMVVDDSNRNSDSDSDRDCIIFFSREIGRAHV